MPVQRTAAGAPMRSLLSAPAWRLVVSALALPVSAAAQAAKVEKDAGES